MPLDPMAAAPSHPNPPSAPCRPNAGPRTTAARRSAARRARANRLRRPAPKSAPPPVCACDGKTYDSACLADKAGASVSFAGFCEKNPVTGCWSAQVGTKCAPITAQKDCNPKGLKKGYKGAAGDSNMYCSAPGKTCETIPANCSATGSVCGEDGKTYSSECTALWTGRVAVKSKGACTKAAVRAARLRRMRRLKHRHHGHRKHRRTYFSMVTTPAP